MTQSSIPKDNEAIKVWPLPEFGLMTHAHHTTSKKLKAKSIINTTLQKQQFEKDFENGLKKGYEAGLLQATQEMQKKLEQLSTLILTLEQHKNNIDSDFKNRSFSFISMICEKIIFEKINTSSEPMNNILSRGLELIDAKTSSLKIYCNELLFDALIKEKKFEDNKQITIEKDEKLPAFSFRIESDKQFLEFNLKASLDKIINESKDLFLGSL